MHSSKLLCLIKGLDQNELHWLQKFLASPFYNSNEAYSRLFQLIKKHAPDFKSPKLDKASICQQLFPKDKSNIQKLRKTMHGLALLVEEFIVAMQIRNNTFEKKKLLIQSLGERNIYDLFEKRTKEVIADLEALPYRDSKTYKEIHELYFEYYSHILTRRQNQNIDILKSSSDHLASFYLLQQLQLQYAFKNHEKLFKDKININSLTEIKESLGKETIFKLHESIIDTIFQPYNEAAYTSMENLFKTEIDQISRKDQLVIIKIFLNYLSNQINKGQEGFQAKMLSLYKFGLAQNILIENHQISEGSFINICTVAIFEKEFSWTENFIKTYKEHLPTSSKADATNLSLGFLFYHKKEYKKTLDLVLNHTFSKPLLILQSKIILLRTYFELYLSDDSYYDLVIAQTQSFEKFIRRNELISNTKKERFLNFVLFIRKIVNTHWYRQTDKSIYQKIEATESVLLKFWLLEKIKEAL